MGRGVTRFKFNLLAKALRSTVEHASAIRAGGECHVHDDLSHQRLADSEAEFL